jgi:hypothetical protein
VNQLLFLLSVLLMLGCHPSPVTTSSFQSEFGYSIDVPQDWKVIDRETLQRSGEAFQDLDLRISDVALESVVRETLSRGNLDAFFIVGDSSNLLATVAAYSDQNPNITTDSDLEYLCGWFPQGFATTTDQPVEIEACEFRHRAGVKAIFLETSGPLPGLVTAMYMVPQNKTSAVLIGATATTEQMEKVRPKFEELVSTLRIDSDA